MLTFVNSLILVTLADVSDRFQMKNDYLMSKWSNQLTIRLETSSIIFVDSDAGDSWKILVAESWCWWLSQCYKLVNNISKLSLTYFFSKQTGSFIPFSIIKFNLLKVLKYELWCLIILISWKCEINYQVETSTAFIS